MNRTRPRTLASIMRRVGVASATLLLWAAAGAGAQVDPELVTTRHQTSIPGRVMAYTAQAGRLPIRLNETGEALATSSSSTTLSIRSLVRRLVP